MDKEAVANRCLWNVTGLASSRCESVGDVACGRRVRVPYADTFYRQVSVLGISFRKQYEAPLRGYQWPMRPMDFSRPSTADFKSYATRWEGRYSAIILDRTATLTLVPVVDATPFFSHDGLASLCRCFQ